MGRTFTGQKAPMVLDLVPVVASLVSPSDPPKNPSKPGKKAPKPPRKAHLPAKLVPFCESLLEEMKFRQENWQGFIFKAYRKGLGVVITRPEGVKK